MQILGEIPFIKPQNNTVVYLLFKQINGQKLWKMEQKDILFWMSFYSLFSAWKINQLFKCHFVAW